ncbi:MULTISPECIES: hypothetical protein [unclassified Crossiella]|uniref:hypothetical protein n=1 Tax=unclassified Crossiella TaxID=2620835 RepID=UPI001FFF574B|nr:MULTISPECIES: hypothetical protein [unclassified Crossiella]MCK2238403.1 hypothetical protein [Crossiella sp. S99.2]MCK2256443.1 hypothetical protein [Crossiella sp. S99.1]
MDLTVSVYEDTRLDVELHGGETLTLVFGGPVQKIIVSLDWDDFDRLYDLMGPFAGIRHREPDAGGAR